jgi:hypothetical protein
MCRSRRPPEEIRSLGFGVKTDQCPAFSFAVLSNEARLTLLMRNNLICYEMKTKRTKIKLTI